MKDLLLITGASSGIGLETTKRCLREGYRVIGIARDFRREAIDSPDFIPIQLDLSDLASLPKAFTNLVKDYPEITGLITCAGQGRFGAIEEFSFDQIKNLMDLNFTSQAFLVKALMPTLKKSGRADIIFIGSESGLEGRKYGAIYCASKFALRGMAQSLRQEGVKSGLRVTTINPGMVRSPFFDALSFAPGGKAENAIEVGDVAEMVLSVLKMRRGTVIDEINLSPLKKVISRKTKNSSK